MSAIRPPHGPSRVTALSPTSSPSFTLAPRFIAPAGLAELARPTARCTWRSTRWESSPISCAACEGEIASGNGRGRHAERGELLDQAQHARGLRALVHAVQARDLALGEMLRDGLVGGDHQLLDQRVRLAVLAHRDRADVAVRVERELGLLGVERQPARLRARVRQRAGDLARGLERRGPRVVGALAPGEDPLHLLVVEAHVRADQRAVERAARHPGAVEVDLHRDGGAREPGHQRAGVVRERRAAASARPCQAGTRSCRAGSPRDRQALPRARTGSRPRCGPTRARRPPAVAVPRSRRRSRARSRDRS